MPRLQYFSFIPGCISNLSSQTGSDMEFSLMPQPRPSSPTKEDETFLSSILGSSTTEGGSNILSPERPHRSYLKELNQQSFNNSEPKLFSSHFSSILSPEDGTKLQKTPHRSEKKNLPSGDFLLTTPGTGSRNSPVVQKLLKDFDSFVQAQSNSTVKSFTNSSLSYRLKRTEVSKDRNSLEDFLNGGKY